MIHPNDEAIRDRAYVIWEREGRPHGRDRDHWLQAAWELAGEEAKAATLTKKAKPAAKAATPTKRAKPAAKAARKTAKTAKATAKKTKAKTSK